MRRFCVAYHKPLSRACSSRHSSSVLVSLTAPAPRIRASALSTAGPLDGRLNHPGPPAGRRMNLRPGDRPPRDLGPRQLDGGTLEALAAPAAGSDWARPATAPCTLEACRLTSQPGRSPDMVKRLAGRRQRADVFEHPILRATWSANGSGQGAASCHRSAGTHSRDQPRSTTAFGGTTLAGVRDSAAPGPRSTVLMDSIPRCPFAPTSPSCHGAGDISSLRCSGRGPRRRWCYEPQETSASSTS